MPQGIAHFLFYQHNVQRFFLEHRGAYDGVIIPLSIATSFQVGTYGFVRALFAEDPNKAFAIDPRTALFQKAWDRNKVRDPHRRMAAALGRPISDEGITAQLQPSRLNSVEACQELTRNCLQYQTSFRVQNEHERKLGKYKKLAGLTELPQIRNPQILIPPYFQFSSLDDPWYGVSFRCATAALDAGYEEEVRPVVHFDAQALKGSLDWNAVASSLHDAGAQSAFLYPNNFKEHDANAVQLSSYVSLVKAFAAAGVAPYALHGGYFAILLASQGLRGFGNGIGYGEWRDSGYHAGGTAELRIYVPRLHRFLSPQELQPLLENHPYFAGGSPLLTECVEESRPLVTLAQDEALDDFVTARHAEIGVVSSGLNAAISDLRETITALDGVGELERSRFGAALERWLAAIG